MFDPNLPLTFWFGVEYPFPLYTFIAMKSAFSVLLLSDRLTLWKLKVEFVVFVQMEEGQGTEQTVFYVSHYIAVLVAK